MGKRTGVNVGKELELDCVWVGGGWDAVCGLSMKNVVGGVGGVWGLDCVW